MDSKQQDAVTLAKCELDFSESAPIAEKVENWFYYNNYWSNLISITDDPNLANCLWITLRCDDLGVIKKALTNAGFTIDDLVITKSDVIVVYAPKAWLPQSATTTAEPQVNLAANLDHVSTQWVQLHQHISEAPGLEFAPEEDIERYGEAIADMRHSYDTLEVENAALKKDLRRAYADQEEMQAALAKAKAENKRLREALSSGLYVDLNHLAKNLEDIKVTGWLTVHATALGFAIGLLRRAAAALQATDDAKGVEK